MVLMKYCYTGLAKEIPTSKMNASIVARIFIGALGGELLYSLYATSQQELSIYVYGLSCSLQHFSDE